MPLPRPATNGIGIDRVTGIETGREHQRGYREGIASRVNYNGIEYFFERGYGREREREDR